MKHESVNMVLNLLHGHKTYQTLYATMRNAEREANCRLCGGKLLTDNN